jgi:hypothetical protein
MRKRYIMRKLPLKTLAALAATLSLSSRSTFASSIDASERFETLFYGERPVVANVFEMDRLGLAEGQTAVTPWTGSEWPLNKGGIAQPFGDGSRPSGDDWSRNHAQALLASGASRSAAEKYDAWLGDSARTLTRDSWEKGHRYFDAYGEVAPWMGLCHGWAAAATNVPEPRREVTVTSPTGEKILFSPDDVKALASQFGAGGRVPVRLIGRRCEPGSEETCAGLNAGSWHVALVNQVGQRRTGLIVNVAPERGQVRNQPVSSYHFVYFNPVTGAPQPLAEARTEMAQLPAARRAAYGTGTHSVVGVNLSVTTVTPSEELPRAPGQALTQERTYRYELELDAKGTILGGHWLQEDRPDFVWVSFWNPKSAPKDALTAAGPENDPSWNNARTVPSEWRDEAITAAARGEILAPLVERLIELAQ